MTPPVPRPRTSWLRTLTPEARRALASKAGKASQAGAGAKQRWTKEQARAAGKKGGSAPRKGARGGRP